MITIKTKNLEEWQAHFDVNELSDLERLINLFRAQIFIKSNASNDDFLHGDRVIGQSIELMKTSLDFKLIIESDELYVWNSVLNDIVMSFYEAFNTTLFTFSISRAKYSCFCTMNLDYSDCNQDELALLLK